MARSSKRSKGKGHSKGQAAKKGGKARQDTVASVKASGSSKSWVRWSIEAELLEDAHFGSGTGGGGIDALVARDRGGKPVIWATHLEGVLRDTAWSLDGDTAAAFFGTRGRERSRILLTSLYLSQASQKKLDQTRIWRSSARHSFDNRAPREDTLRAIEFVPRGTRFKGEVELLANDLRELEQKVAQVTALGQGRATGAGRVKLTLKDLRPAPRRVTGSGERLLLLLRNRDPVCIAATSVPGNLIPTAPFIPGRTLLGALAAWLVEEGRSDAAKALVDGTLSVGDALPVPDDAAQHLSTTEVLPAPLALQSEKPEGTVSDVPWWADQTSQSVTRRNALNGAEPTSGGERLKLKRPEPDLFVVRFRGSDPWRTLRPDISVRLRSGRADPSKEEPDLFAVEQIAEETRLLTEIAGPADKLGPLVQALTPVFEGSRWLRIGRGGAPVEVTHAVRVPRSAVKNGITNGYLTFTSDVLVRDDRLLWFRRLQPDDFQRHVAGWPNDVKVGERCFQDEVTVHGFNGTARMRRLPIGGIRRGSTFKVEGSGVAELARLAAQGKWLGERCHEGFGRFRVDAELPGIPAAEETGGSRADPDADDETIAVETWQSAESYDAPAGGEAPSKAQWYDFVTALESGGSSTAAIRSRLKPQTAGGSAWTHAAAKTILNQLLQKPNITRATYVRYFLRSLLARRKL